MSLRKAQAEIATRDRIMDAAARLFQMRGYHGVGLAEILEAANAPKGSLYHHFAGGKEELAIAVLDKVAGDVIALITKRSAAGKTGAAILREVAMGMGAWLAKTEWMQRGIVSALADGAGPETPKLRSALEGVQGVYINTLGKALERDGFPRAEARALASIALAAIDGGMLQARLARDMAPLQTITARVSKLLER